MVYRVYVEKKKELALEAASLATVIRGRLQITSVEEVRLLNRYDAENIDQALFDYSVTNVFSEPQLDLVTYEPDWDGYTVFAVEPLPGQFDQRADSAAQCIQILSTGERPEVKTARVYLLKGNITADELAAIKKHVINPVESREASLEKPETLKTEYEIPTSVAVLEGFRSLDEAGMEAFIRDYGLAMDLGDITFCRDYFVKEQRDPTLTEIRMIDTYWSDHCRHTTFNTILDEVRFEDPEIEAAYQSYVDARRDLGRTKPICLMDMGTLAVKCLRKAGKLDRLDESEEINACTVKTTVTVDGREEEWLLLFKNETHNHPTEIEPFGGAATCIGGAIRDPLSGRSYVYGAMRVTGAADPTVPVSATIPGKLPQRAIVTKAASGYSSYGNQIGLATGQVTELYHPGYAAKRMEVGAVIAAAPAANVRRERPAPGDVVILLGGRTGRDGCGGATGSSKSHTVESLATCGAEVQKGNAPEERKLQRLFRNAEASRLIKRCNDFGAGGVSVAIGELADGLAIDLNAVPKKYDGLDGTELAISESQERMAVVVAAEDMPRFMELAAAENLEATLVATVTEAPRLTMTWNGVTIVDISREFLDSNGAEKHMTAVAKAAEPFAKAIPSGFAAGMKELAQDLNVASQRGLCETFDASIGAGTVVMPFGGKKQLTPIQAMVHKVSVERGHTDTCSLMSFGFNPYISEKSPYHGAYLAVVESASKLVASGAEFREVYLSFQEYFGKLGREPQRWGLPMSALLGAFRAQLDLGIGAIGGKDSMSGTFEDLDVPATLISFAVTTEEAPHIITNARKGSGHSVRLVCPAYTEKGLPVAESLLEVYKQVIALMRSGKVLAAYTPGFG
ncbi:MAG: phosphoribosylformylglycinamidine synthase, partial [Oscillospiraceae bacterium]|nr:phosphoribosylformylglycinamidine synthase [Oscillospiraceae bacterium]